MSNGLRRKISALERIEAYSKNYGVSVESLAFYNIKPATVSKQQQAFEIVLDLLTADPEIDRQGGD